MKTHAARIARLNMSNYARLFRDALTFARKYRESNPAVYERWCIRAGVQLSNAIRERDQSNAQPATPGTVRRVAMVRLYDADLKEHTFGPITVEIPEHTAAESDVDAWTHDDREARLALQADMSCDTLAGILAQRTV